jgi:hypothetical protein
VFYKFSSALKEEAADSLESFGSNGLHEVTKREGRNQNIHGCEDLKPTDNIYVTERDSSG